MEQAAQRDEIEHDGVGAVKEKEKVGAVETVDEA